MPVLMSLHRLAAGVLWTPAAFKVSPVCELKAWCQSCCSPFYTHTFDRRLLDHSRGPWPDFTVCALLSAQLPICAELGSHWTLTLWFFFFSSILPWVLSIFLRSSRLSVMAAWPLNGQPALTVVILSASWLLSFSRPHLAFPHRISSALPWF